MIDNETYKKLLEGITVETIKEAHNVTVFINEKMSENVGTDAPKLSDALKSVVLEALLIEYGKHQARTERSVENAKA